MAIHHVHDMFFKNALKHKSVSKEFFNQLLPANIRQLIDLNHLTLNDSSFVDKELRATSCDLLFETKFAKKPGYLYLLAEEQYNVHKYMPLRLLRYMLDIMHQHTTIHPGEPLPIVYPITFFAGDKPYNAPMDLIELFAESDRELARQILHNPFQLVDIKLTNDADFERHAMFKAFMLSMKYRRCIDQHLGQLADSLVIIDQMGEIDYINTVVTYILDAGEAESPEDFMSSLVEALPENQRENMQSIAQHLVGRGRVEGRVEGLKEASRNIARNMLSKDINIDIIVETTDLSYDEVMELHRKMFR